MSVVVLGIDPGFASTGYALVRLGEDRTVLRCGLLRTEKEQRKRQVLAADDNLRRARELAREIVRRCLDDGPVNAAMGPQVRCALGSHEIPVAIVLESMSFPRSASVANKMGLALGVVAAIAEARGLPLVQESPQRIKLALCGRRDASKESVATAVSAIVGRVPLDPIPASQREHVWDAIAAALACERGSMIQIALRMAEERQLARTA